MASTRQIKSRIRSVSSNKQITKAMELVASSKLRRAQERAQSTKRFNDAALDILATLAATTDVRLSPLYEKRKTKTRMIIVLTSDRGLAGAYNANALKVLMKKVRSDDERGISTMVITVGRKAAHFVAKLKDVEAHSSYQIGDHVAVDDIRPIFKTVTDMFLKGEIDNVKVVTTRFVNSFTQTPELMNLLPAGPKVIESHMSVGDPKFEPSTEEVLDYVTRRLVEAQLYQAVLDARASEHAMRRVAMKNASDNASEIVDALTLEMNKVRQAAITQELSEISAGVEAMS